jgi:hypothetical protein
VVLSSVRAIVNARAFAQEMLALQRQQTGELAKYKEELFKYKVDNSALLKCCDDRDAMTADMEAAVQVHPRE